MRKLNSQKTFLVTIACLLTAIVSLGMRMFQEGMHLGFEQQTQGDQVRNLEDVSLEIRTTLADLQKRVDGLAADVHSADGRIREIAAGTGRLYDSVKTQDASARKLQIQMQKAEADIKDARVLLEQTIRDLPQMLKRQNTHATGGKMDVLDERLRKVEAGVAQVLRQLGDLRHDMRMLQEQKGTQ